MLLKIKKHVLFWGKTYFWNFKNQNQPIASPVSAKICHVMLVSRKQYFTTREHYSEICRSPRSWVVAQVRRGGEPDVTTPVSVDIVQVIAKAMFRYAGILPNPQD